MANNLYPKPSKKVASLVRNWEKSWEIHFPPTPKAAKGDPGLSATRPERLAGMRVTSMVEAAQAWMIYTPRVGRMEAENWPMIIHGTIVYLPTFLVDDYGICYKIGKYTVCVDGMGDDFQFSNWLSDSLVPC